MEIGNIYDIKYKTINLGDKIRWLNNMKLIRITEYTINNEDKEKELVFEQQSKRPVKFYINQSNIYYFRKHKTCNK